MRKINYDEPEKYTGNTEPHIATDVMMEEGFNSSLKLEEGFAASSGIRNETAETGGRVKAPEKGDASIPAITLAKFEEENAGLADA